MQCKKSANCVKLKCPASSKMTRQIFFISLQQSWQMCFCSNNKDAIDIHVKERNAIFPFPESCPFFSESERKAGLIWKGRKGTGKERYDGAKFPFLSISDFPIWKTKFSISSKKVIKLGGHFLEFCITSNGRALVGALVGVMEGHFYHVELTLQ